MAPAAIALGLALDALLGDPRRFHPVAGFGAVAAACERRVWRPSRLAGAAHAAGLAGGAAMLAAAVERLLPARLRTAYAALVVFVVLGGRSLAREAVLLARALERGDLDDARRRAPALVGRDPDGMDSVELARAAVESVAENTADAVVGPLLWAAAAGTPGALFYRAVNTLDAMVGYRTPHYERFGWASARLDDVCSWPGARVTALLAVAAAPAVGGSLRPTLQTLVRDGPAHPSPNAGLCEAAFAGALRIRLGGVNRYAGRVEERPQLGDGRAPEAGDVLRAVRLSRLVSLGAAAVSVSLAGRRRR
jgi:adenosylcobinamide-phosphate synthase